MDKNQIYGIYGLEKIEVYKNGAKTSDSAKAGIFTFLKNNTLSVISASQEHYMSYTGSFEIKGEALIIDIVASNFPDLENKKIERPILKLDGKNLVLKSKSTQSDGYALLYWVKIQEI